MSITAHIGFYKTGTTTLQKQVFPKLKKTTFYGFKESMNQFYDVMFLDDLYYDEQRHINYFNELSNEQAVLFSQEALSGFNYFIASTNRSLIANRLHKIGFTKIIITIRSQLTAIESIYREYIKMGGVLPFKKYFNDEKKIVEKHFSFNQFEYWKLTQLYCQLFGKENVCVLPLELFTQNKKVYLQKIETFLSDELEEPVYQFNPIHNRGMSNLSLKIMRFCNHFVYSYFKPSNLLSNKISSYHVQKVLRKVIDPLVYRTNKQRSSFISESHRKQIHFYYKENNQYLNDFFNLQLEAYNYPL